MTDHFTNRLINESSPYLLQHAYNPVNWYPWGEEALQEARAANKVILVSIGYSACHWCHVMEKESFENEAVAALMNEHFINIKIDREERPDLDHIYMNAVQAMTGNGGWPLNVFLTPDSKPFFGGTYFPPVKAYNRSSWTDVLNGINEAWINRSEEIKEQAENLTSHLKRSNEFDRFNNNTESIDAGSITKEQIDTIFQNCMQSADKEWGGFGNTPKFPQTFVIQFLLQYNHYTGNKDALEQALLSIDKMLQGGIYDQVGGGLARYSTDKEWLAPHFEKMLYDNALFINILCDAFVITKNRVYEKAIRKTIAFLENELMHAEGGFYSALDADSEGEEGKYYVWQKDEIEDLLGNDATMFCEFFDVSVSGNWLEAHKGSTENARNILRILKNSEQFAQEKGLDPGEFEMKMESCLEILRGTRDRRIRPLTDDKILLNWNALMITALCKASAALNEEKFGAMAEKCFDFISKNLRSKNEGQLMHTYKSGIAKYPAFLDDHAFLVQACIHLQELTSKSSYILTAKRLCNYVLEHFTDEGNGFFFFTGKTQKDVIIRKKEVYDGAIASGNSIMAENLFYLSVIFDETDWKMRAQKMLDSLRYAMVRYPTSFGVWAAVSMRQFYVVNEIVITGPDFVYTRNKLLQQYMPGKIMQCSALPDSGFPLLAGKGSGSESMIYLCKNYVCNPPVNSLEKLILLLEKSP